MASSAWLPFLIMSVTSICFSLILFLKSRAVKKIPRNLSATVFSRTFNVFDPFPKQRSMLQSDFFIILTSLSVPTVVLVLCVMILASGLFVELATFFLCLGLMMTEEATEIYSTANTLVKAVKRQTSFGQGDIYVLGFVKKTIARMSVYYILLSVLFAALFFTMPYMFPSLVLGFSQFISLITSATIGITIIGPFVAALLFILFTTAVFLTAGRVKTAFFGFLPSDLFQTDGIMAHWILHERV